MFSLSFLFHDKEKKRERFSHYIFRFFFSHQTKNQKPWKDEICSQLYCSQPDDNSGTQKCTVNSPGAADGTPCGVSGEKWCYRGKCIEKNQTPSGKNKEYIN